MKIIKKKNKRFKEIKKLKCVGEIFNVCNEKLKIAKKGFHWVKIIHMYWRRNVAVIQIITSEPVSSNGRRRKKTKSPTPDKKCSYLRSTKKELLITDDWESKKNIDKPEKWLPSYLLK